MYLWNVFVILHWSCQPSLRWCSAGAPLVLRWCSAGAPLVLRCTSAGVGVNGIHVRTGNGADARGALWFTHALRRAARGEISREGLSLFFRPLVYTSQPPPHPPSRRCKQTWRERWVFFFLADYFSYCVWRSLFRHWTTVCTSSRFEVENVMKLRESLRLVPLTTSELWSLLCLVPTVLSTCLSKGENTKGEQADKNWNFFARLSKKAASRPCHCWVWPAAQQDGADSASVQGRRKWAGIAFVHCAGDLCSLLTFDEAELFSFSRAGSRGRMWAHLYNSNIPNSDGIGDGNLTSIHSVTTFS